MHHNADNGHCAIGKSFATFEAVVIEIGEAMKISSWTSGLAMLLMAYAPLTNAETVLERVSSGGKLVIAHGQASVPFSYVDPTTKQPVGYAVDLCLKIADAVRKKTSMKNMPVEFVMVKS
jgi:ABC-type amino acid transport substrate-binding protein